MVVHHMRVQKVGYKTIKKAYTRKTDGVLTLYAMARE